MATVAGLTAHCVVMLQRLGRAKRLQSKIFEIFVKKINDAMKTLLKPCGLMFLGAVAFQSCLAGLRAVTNVCLLCLPSVPVPVPVEVPVPDDGYFDFETLVANIDTKLLSKTSKWLQNCIKKSIPSIKNYFDNSIVCEICLRDLVTCFVGMLGICSVSSSITPTLKSILSEVSINSSNDSGDQLHMAKIESYLISEICILGKRIEACRAIVIFDTKKLLEVALGSLMDVLVLENFTSMQDDDALQLQNNNNNINNEEGSNTMSNLQRCLLRKNRRKHFSRMRISGEKAAAQTAPGE